MLKYAVIALCVIQPTISFLYSFDDALSLFSNSDKIFENFKRTSGNSEKDALCDEHFRVFIDGLNKKEEWATKMFDSWGKLPAGLFYGNTMSFGNYDQCMSIQHSFASLTSKPSLLTGQVCLMPMIKQSEIQLFQNVDMNQSFKILKAIHDEYFQKYGKNYIVDAPPFVAGVCVPAVCDPKRIPVLLNEFVQQFNYSVPLFDATKLCESNEVPQFRAIDWVAVIVFGGFGCLLICSTVYDVVVQKMKITPSNLFRSFSIYTNGDRLVSCKQATSLDVIHCLNGIRAVSVIWIVWGHTYFTYMKQPSINGSAFKEQWAQSMFAMVNHNFNFVVDTFLVMGGLLMARQFFKAREDNKKLNLLELYFHRYLRLTVAIAAAILFTVTLLKYAGNGPIWSKTISTSIKLCEKNWWSALLHVQNYVNPNTMCLGHAWYISLDMQLFMISPILLYPIWRWGRKYIAIIIILILFSVAFTFAMVYTHNFHLLLKNPEAYLEWLRYVYVPTHTRMGPYLIGLLMGYLLHECRNKPVHINKVNVAIAWTFSIGAILSIIFGTHGVYLPELNETVFQSACYQSLSRIFWALAISWIIFACHHNYGGLIGWFLSLPVWQPIAALSYSIYIVHFVIETMLAGTERQSVYLSDLAITHRFWGDFGFSLTVAFVWALSFEIPFMILEKCLYGMRNNVKNAEDVDIGKHKKDPNLVILVVNKDK